MRALILILLTVTSAYQMVLHFIQYRSANNPTPDNVKDIYDADTYQKWKKYSGEKCRLKILSSFFSWLVVFLMMLFKLDAKFSGMFHKNIYVQLFAVLILHAVIDSIFGAITGYVDTMIIEQKYGFNRSSMKTFVLDQLRSFIIGLLLAGAISVILAALHVALGNWMIPLFAAAIFVITLLISFLYPILSRIGNKFTPLEEGELRSKLSELLTKHGYHVKEIEVMDASRRTTKLNAYFTGFGKLKTIVLYDNLINSMTPDEILAVFAHELGHGLHKDVLKQQVMNIGNLFIMALAAFIAVYFPSLHTVFGFECVNYGFAFILLGSAFLPLVSPLSDLLMNAYSRHAEYRADRQAVIEGYGEPLKTALKKLARNNFSHLSPSKILVVLEYSHPPVSARLDAIDKYMK